MPDIEALNGVAAADIEAVNGVAKADIQAVNGVDMPGGVVAATHWACCFHATLTSWVAAADVADVTKWEDNTWTTHGEGGSTEMFDIAYGKDNSGNPIYVAIANSTGNNIWVDQNNDITDGSSWSRIQIPSGSRKQRETILWGNDVWVTVGRVASGVIDVHRSTDGAASFSAIDIAGLTNISTSDHIYALSSDGAGNWMIGQGPNLYFSSDDAASWAFLLQPEGTGNIIKDIVYTNSTWVVLYDDGSDDSWLITCPASTSANMDATSDWGTAVQLSAANQVDAAGNSTATASHLDGSLSKRMAAAGGRVVVLQCGSATNSMAKTQAADVSGKTCTVENTIIIVPLSEGDGNCIATDGITWLIGGDGGNTGGDGGEILRSTDGGDSWTLIVNGITSTNRKINGIAPSVYLPL